MESTPGETPHPDVPAAEGARPAEGRTLAYRADLDGLRAVAVVAVLLYHFELGCPGGYIGVDVFFVLSGFLMTSIIVRGLDAGTFTLRGFWERRIRRIFPPLVVVVAVSGLLARRFLIPDDFRDFWGSVAAHAVMASNLWFLAGAGYFAAPSDAKPLLHFWSLAVEEQFYLLLPLLLMGLVPRGRGLLRGAVAGLAVVSFGLGVWGSIAFPNAAYLILPTRAWELLAGSLLALAPERRVRPRWGIGAGERAGAGADLVAGLGLAAIGVSAFVYHKGTPFPGVAALLPVLGTAAVIWAGSWGAAEEPRGGEGAAAGEEAGETTKGSVVTRLLSLDAVRGVGLISYSLYLWHWPLLVFWRQAHFLPPTVPERIGLLAASVLLAVLSWVVVETPFRRRAILPERPRLFWSAAATTLVMIGAGTGFWLSNGWPDRLDPQARRYAAVVAEPPVYHKVTLDDVRSDRLIEIGGRRTSGPVHCLVWGDSHAMHLFPVLKGLADDADRRCVAATYTSTAPLLGYPCLAEHSLKEQAVAFNAAVVEYAVRNKVSDVLLAGLWAAYWTGPVDPRTGQTMIETCMDRTAEALRAAGIRVWVLKQIPIYVPLDVPRTLAKLSIAGRDGDILRISRAEHESRQQPYEPMFRDLPRRGATVLDPLPFLSAPDGRTLIEADGTLLYRDATHLTEAGAMRLRPLLAPLFQAEGPILESRR